MILIWHDVYTSPVLTLVCSAVVAIGACEEEDAAGRR
jgi:hypothetical protein